MKRADIERRLALQNQEVIELTGAVESAQVRDEMLDQIAALSTPSQDRLVFYDVSGARLRWLTPGIGITIDDNIINVTSSGGVTTAQIGARIALGI